MKLGWGTGEIIIVLLVAASYFFGVPWEDALALLLLLSGVWTLATGLLFADKRDRNYYVSWGVVVAVLSAFVVLPPNFAIGLILVAIVALILLTAYSYRSGKMYTATTQGAPPSSGGTPAASFV